MSLVNTPIEYGLELEIHFVKLIYFKLCALSVHTMCLGGIPLGLELQVVVSDLTLVLGIKLRSCRRREPLSPEIITL